ncbi:MAG TPA: class I SAM-dependent methyltransferase [Solirubrobacterales bacterium]|jgi:SAM-dependent methyltransferase
MYEDSIREEFTHQTDVFARAGALKGAQVLGALVDLVPADPEARWLEVACGPSMVGRAVAPRIGSLHGVDLTPAMIERAREEAAREGLANAEFGIGDATALEFEDGSFDGAITRFSLHHIPAPQRVVEEMARVVRPGGLVVIADHARDDDAAVAAWVEEIERLRDPSHWSCLTPARLRAIGAAAGLEPDREELVPFELEFEDWRDRSSGGKDAAALIDRLLEEVPPGAEAFRVVGEGAERKLLLQNMLFRWRRA